MEEHKSATSEERLGEVGRRAMEIEERIEDEYSSETGMFLLPNSASFEGLIYPYENIKGLSEKIAETLAGLK